MTGTIEEQSNEKKTSAKTRSKQGGRRSRATTAKKHKAPPGKAAARLRSAINSLVGEDSGRFAEALVKKTITGNLNGARLLAVLADDKKPPLKPLLEKQKKRRGPSAAELLASEPEWDAGSDTSGHDGAPFGPLEPEP